MQVASTAVANVQQQQNDHAHGVERAVIPQHCTQLSMWWQYKSKRQHEALSLAAFSAEHLGTSSAPGVSGSNEVDDMITAHTCIQGHTANGFIRCSSAPTSDGAGRSVDPLAVVEGDGALWTAAHRSKCLIRLCC